MQSFKRSMLVLAALFAVSMVSQNSADAQGYGFGSNVQSNGYYGGLSTLQHAPLHGGRPNPPVSPNTNNGNNYIYGGSYYYSPYGSGYSSLRPNYGDGYGVPAYGYGYGVPAYGTGYGYGYGVQTYGTQLNIYPGGVIQGYTGRFPY